MTFEVPISCRGCGRGGTLTVTLASDFAVYLGAEAKKVVVDHLPGRGPEFDGRKAEFGCGCHWSKSKRMVFGADGRRLA